MSVGRAPADLERYYDQLESVLPIRWTHDYGSLVVANGNAEAPFHRWFRFKEAYSCRLFERVVKDASLDGRRELRVLDPYSGSGTTAVSVAQATRDGALRSAAVYALETNPYLHLVSDTKLRALQEPPHQFLRFARRVAAIVAQDRVEIPAAPELSTFHQPGHFDKGELTRLLSLREAIRVAGSDGAEPLEIDLALVCLGSIVERVSGLRRDGRALRRVTKQSQASALQSFLDAAHQVDEDLPRTRVPISGRVIRGDGRFLEGIDGRHASFDLALYSPPYPNNIDYTEVYKLENWLLGLISSTGEFTQQRHRTVYSHPSVLRADPIPSPHLSEVENQAIERIVEPVVAAVPDDRYRLARTRMLRGYVHDMYLTLRSCHSKLKSGGRAVYVVGNSVHGRNPNEFVVAADLLLSACAREVGFVVERFEVARELRRRAAASNYLRESVVFLRKDE